MTRLLLANALKHDVMMTMMWTSVVVRWTDGLRGPGLLHWHRVSWEHPLSHRSRPDGDPAS